jgi:hypothetical protein
MDALTHQAVVDTIAARIDLRQEDDAHALDQIADDIMALLRESFRDRREPCSCPRRAAPAPCPGEDGRPLCPGADHA